VHVRQLDDAQAIECLRELSEEDLDPNYLHPGPLPVGPPAEACPYRERTQGEKATQKLATVPAFGTLDIRPYP